MDPTFHSIGHWPHLLGPRRNRKGQFCTTFTVPAIWLNREGRREGNRHNPSMEALFRAACLGFEALHGQRLLNDFRNDLPESAGPADSFHDAARVASRGGKEIREGPVPMCRLERGQRADRGIPL